MLGLFGVFNQEWAFNHEWGTEKSGTKGEGGERGRLRIGSGSGVKFGRKRGTVFLVPCMVWGFWIFGTWTCYCQIIFVIFIDFMHSNSLLVS